MSTIALQPNYFAIGRSASILNTYFEIFIDKSEFISLLENCNDEAFIAIPNLKCAKACGD